jgi:HK97 family phage portal protein
MGILDRLYGWLHKWTGSRLAARRSRGERLLGTAGSSFAWPGGWSANRSEQVGHYRSWVYAGIQARAHEMARHEPHIDYVSEQSSSSRIAQVNAHTLRARVKAVNRPRPHEELHPAENDHPLVQLLKQPNPYDSLEDIYFELELFLCLTGNGYLWTPFNQAGLPSELWVLPSHWVRAVPGKDRLVEGYWLLPYGGAGGPGDAMLPAEEVIHFKEKNPLHKVDGYSPLTAGAEIIDVSEAINTSRWSHFERGMQPGLHIELSEDEANPDDAEMDRIYAKYRARFEGRDAHGRPIITRAGTKVSKISMTPEEMGYFQSAEQMATFVLAMLRTPKELTGMQPIGTDLSWYAPLRFFCRFVVSPRLKSLGSAMSRRVGVLYDPPLRVWHEDPTPDDPKQVNEDLRTDKDLFALTPNEVRSLRGREPFEGWGDRPMVAGNWQQAQFPGDPSPLQPEKPLQVGGKPGGSGTNGTASGNGRVALPGGGNGRVAASLAGWRRKGGWHEEDHPRAGDGRFGQGTGHGGDDEEDEEDTPEPEEDTEAEEAAAEWESYDQEHAAWQAETDAIQATYDKAKAEYDRLYARWEEDTQRLEQRHEEDQAAWQEAHAAWEEREVARDRKKNAIDEATPVEDADSHAGNVFEAVETPSWDSANQQEPLPHYLAQVDTLVTARLEQWDAAFGKDSLARNVLAGTDEKLQAKWDKLTDRCKDKLIRQADKYRAAAEKYGTFQDNLEIEQKRHKESEPEAPDEPDLDEPDEPDEPALEKPYLPTIAAEQGLPPERAEYDTDEEYREALAAHKQEIEEAYREAKAEYEREWAEYRAAKEEYDREKADYDRAWKDHDAALEKYEKDSAAWQKEDRKIEKMEAAAEKLSEKVDTEEGGLATVWDDQRDFLIEEQDEIKNTLAERIDAEAENDPEPEEPDEPEYPDEPEAPEEPDFPDEPEEPDVLRPERKKSARRLHTRNGKA